MEFAFRIVERTVPVALWLHTEDKPRDEPWKEACDVIRKTPDFQKMRMLIVTDGGAPTIFQRTELAVGVFDGKGFKSVALTKQLSNPITRGLARAITWTNPAFKALGPLQWQEALKFLDLEPDIFAEFELLQVQLSKQNATLEIIREAVRARRAS